MLTQAQTFYRHNLAEELGHIVEHLILLIIGA